MPEFVREIVGLDMNAAKEAFSEYLNSVSIGSRQIYFVNQIVEYIVHNGMMKDLSVLQESPFTDQGSVVEIFSENAHMPENREVTRSLYAFKPNCDNIDYAWLIMSECRYKT